MPPHNALSFSLIPFPPFGLRCFMLRLLLFELPPDRLSLCFLTEHSRCILFRI